jgi:hypothetical protein
MGYPEDTLLTVTHDTRELGEEIITSRECLREELILMIPLYK